MATFKLTGKPVSEDLQNVLLRLEKGEYVPIEDIERTPELKLARSCLNNSIATNKLSGREELQDHILEQLQKKGAAVIDSNGKVQYNGDVSKNSRLDIVIGFPGSGKSTAIVDVISNEFHSQIVDNDEAKKLIPEFNNGWGAGVVHEESQKISEQQLFEALLNQENIVLPKVGSDYNKINEIVSIAKTLGYEVNIHFVDLDREKALGRMLSRFVEEGRFLDPKLIDKYCNNIDGNKIARCYEMLKKGGIVDGYSKWSNDVERGERPILIEAECSGKFIRNARTSEHINDNLRNAGRVGNKRSSGIQRYERKSGIMEKSDKAGADAQDRRNSQTSRGTILKKLEQYKSEVIKRDQNRTDHGIAKEHQKRQPER